MTKRFEGKEMLGCWVSTDLIRAITEWRGRPENHGKSKTDFVIEAAMDKLDEEKIAYDRALVLQDGRSKLELPPARTITSYHAEARRVSSKPLSVAEKTAIAHAPEAARLAQESERKQKAGGPSVSKPAPGGDVGKGKR